MLNTLHKSFAGALAALILLALAHSAHALPLLTLTPTQTTMPVSAGGSVQITGSIINRTNTVLDATDLFLNFGNFDPGALTPQQTLGLVLFSIPSLRRRMARASACTAILLVPVCPPAAPTTIAHRDTVAPAQIVAAVPHCAGHCAPT